MLTLDEFIKEFHIMLNDQQLAAVQAIEEPTLFLAVPGSGKTTVLVTRIGYMVYCKGIAPEEMVAFGDNENDRSMLEFVGQPYLMQKCNPTMEDVKANHCDRVEDVLRQILNEML